jgi:hypothetical protein
MTRRLLARSKIKMVRDDQLDGFVAYLRARVFLRLRLSLLTRFFLHLALIFDN